MSFEVDELDPRTRSGWSVLVLGTAEPLTGAEGAAVVLDTLAVGVRPWAPGDYGTWVRLTPEGISGRRIVPGELPPAVDPRAYL